MNSKEKRKERKKKKLLAEYELTKSNDELNRPGELLDSDEARINLNGEETKKLDIAGIDGDRKIPAISRDEMKLLKQQAKERKRRIGDFETVKSILEVDSEFFKEANSKVENVSVSKKSRLETNGADKDCDVNNGVDDSKGNGMSTAKEGRRRLSPEEFKKLKLQLKERKKMLSNIPRFQLQAAGITASLSMEYNIRVPVLMCDIQHLLLYSLCGNDVINQPNRWCMIQKHNNLTHIVVLIVEGLSVNDLLLNEHLFPKLTSSFPDRVEVLAPTHYGSEISQELAAVPLSVTQKDKLLRKFGTLEAAVSSKEVFKVFRSIFPIELDKSGENGNEANSELLPKPSLKSSKVPDLPSEDMFSRVYLLLGLNQMLSENFPLPIENQVSNKYSDFKMTKKKYKEVSAFSPLFAIDCEMCMTDVKSELTRIAVVNEKYEVVYDTLVKPSRPIVNYLTKFSGITKEILQDITTTLEDVQKAMQNILPEDAILVGHSLNCDLEAMQMIHPYVIDTSIIFNMTGYRGRKSKLANLSEYFLKEAIQQDKSGHCPREDATAVMKLVKLKLSKGYNFGDYSLDQTKHSDNLIPECQLTSSIFSQTRKANKTVAMIGTEESLQTYKSFSSSENNSSVFMPIPENSPKLVVAALKDAAVNHNFALAHLSLTKKLEKIQTSEKSTIKYEKLLRKTDNWCDQVLSHVSLNGLCVILFSGETKQKSVAEQKYQPNDKDNDDSSTSNDSSSLPKTTLEESSTSPQPEVKIKVDTNPRQNGVCFVRINSARNKIA